jgi:hypothetical protein
MITGGYPDTIKVDEIPVTINDDTLAQEYATTLVTNEGNYTNASFLHKPTKGSGWTIGNGLDARFTSAAEMRGYGVPERIVSYIEKNKAFGTTRVNLPKGQRNALRMTKEEFTKVNLNIAKDSVKEMREYSDGNPDLSKKSVAYLAQIKHWAGSFEGSKISKTTRMVNGKLVSPISDLLKAGNATNEKLIEALEVIKKSYVGKGQGKNNGKGTYRYATITRYINNLKKT